MASDPFNTSAYRRGRQVSTQREVSSQRSHLQPRPRFWDDSLTSLPDGCSTRSSHGTEGSLLLPYSEKCSWPQQLQTSCAQGSNLPAGSVLAVPVQGTIQFAPKKVETVTFCQTSSAVGSQIVELDTTPSNTEHVAKGKIPASRIAI